MLKSAHSYTFLLFLLCHAVNAFLFPLDLSVLFHLFSIPWDARSLLAGWRRGHGCCSVLCLLIQGNTILKPVPWLPLVTSPLCCYLSQCHPSASASPPPMLPPYCSSSSFGEGHPSPPTRQDGHWGHVVENAACHKNGVEHLWLVGWTLCLQSATNISTIP